MNALESLQFMLSLAVQATALTGCALAWDRRCRIASVQTRIWTYYYLCLLGIFCSGLFLPRLCLTGPWRSLSPRLLLAVIRGERWIATAILIVWLAGAFVLLARWFASFVRLKLVLRNCREVEAEDRERLQSLIPYARVLPHDRAVQFRLGPEELGPFCYQLHRPVICLPPSLLRGDRAVLTHVLQHELEHLRTQHPLQVFAQRIVETLFWQLPVVWTAGRRASLAREFVCDDAATREGTTTASYLKTLLHFAQRQASTKSASLAIARSPSELSLRARRLASQESRRDNRYGVLAPVSIVLAALLISQVWLPTNPLASTKSFVTPWPEWTASVLHSFNIPVRDFDRYDAQLQLHDLVRSETSSPAVQ